MEQDIQVTVLSATPRVVGNRTIYDIALSDGNTYSTFDAAIFAKANSLLNQPASARVKVGPNPKKPQYTNYYLNDIAPQGQLPPPGVTVHAAPAAQERSFVGQPVPQGSAVQKAPNTFNGGMTPEREQKIVKQSSLATAFRYAASAGLSEEEAIELAARIYFRVMGEPFEGNTVAPEPVAAGADEDKIPW